MAQSDTFAGEAARIRERLAQLDAERGELERRLAEFAHSPSAQQASASLGGPVTNRSPTSAQRYLVSAFALVFPGEIYRCATGLTRPATSASIAGTKKGCGILL